MKVLKFAFLTSLLLFAWSVCVSMLNLSADEDMSIMGIPGSYFMLPLLMCNVAIIVKNGFMFPHDGISSVILAWLLYVSFATAIHMTQITDLIRVTLWPTTYFSCYILGENNPDFLKKLRSAFVVIFVMGVVYFILAKILKSNVSRLGLATTTNVVFCVVTVLPFLLLSPQKKLAITGIIITFLCVIFSNKRSVTLAFAVALLPTLYGLFSGIKSKGRKFFIISVLGIGALVAFNYIANTYLDGAIFDRFQDMEDDEGSGRVEIWSYVLNAFQDSDFISQLFGHGHYTVSSLGDATAAHNDFLEVLYDYGAIAFVIYLLLHRSIIKKVLRLRRQQSPLFASFFFFAVVFIVMSWISILIPQQRYIVYMAVYLAYIDIEVNLKQK